jgi:hypothetical protein
MPSSPVSAGRKARILAEALPFIRAFHATTLVIRFGGAAMADPVLREAFARDVALLQLVGMHPVIVHGGGWRIDQILQRMGIDRLHVFRFDRAFSALSAEAFIERVLGRTLQARYVLVGDDFRYGAKRAGDFALLQQAGQSLGFDATPTVEVRLARLVHRGTHAPLQAN